MIDTTEYILVAVGSSGILKLKQKQGVTFNFNKQDVIDFMRFSKMTICRTSEANSEKKLFLGKNNIKGCFFISKLFNGNLIVKLNLEKHNFLVIPISKNGPDMASVHKFWYFLLVIHSFSITNFNSWTKLYIRDF